MQRGIVAFEDLDIFFNVDEFAIKASLEFVGAIAADLAPQSVVDSADNRVVDSADNVVVSPDATVLALDGIFDTPYMKRDFGAFVVDAEAPSYTCKWIDAFADIRKGDILLVGEGDEAQTFYIDSAPQNDGTGVVSFLLTPASTQDAIGDDLDDSVDEAPDPNDPFFG